MKCRFNFEPTFLIRVRGTDLKPLSLYISYESHLLIKINTNKNEIRFPTQLPF